MKRYHVEYEADGQRIVKKNITFEELEEFIKTIDEEKMKKILNGESSLWVRREKEEQER